MKFEAVIQDSMTEREYDRRGVALNGQVELQTQVASSQTDHVGPLLDGRGIIHHLGFLVTSISAVAEEFALSMSARWDGQIIHDPLQRARVAFFIPADPRNPVFELVEPAGEVSPVSSFVKKGGGLHHVCYEVDDLESVLQQARGVGFAIASDPTPAVAFGGRRIAWVQSKRRLLIEFLERRPESQDRRHHPGNAHTTNRS